MMQASRLHDYLRHRSARHLPSGAAVLLGDLFGEAIGMQATEARRAGWIGAVALLLGTVLPFIVGVCVARAFGYSDAVSMTTIGAGAIAGDTPVGRGASPETVNDLRRRGIVQRPEDLGIQPAEAARDLLAAKTIGDSVAQSGGLYDPPEKFRNSGSG